jgi:ATP-dependent Lhr-like helicase
MQQVLAEDKSYPYLMTNATARLREARATAQAAEMLNESLINLGGKMWCLFPWTGTYAFLALERLLRLKCADRLGLRGFNSVRPYYMEFSMDASADEFYQVIGEEAAKDFDPLDLVFENEVPVFDKYDQYVPDELIKKGFARGVLDVKTMKSCVRRMIRKHRRDKTKE